VKERPILFTPGNAQKCHDGTKTQTRRIIKNQPGKFVHIEYDERKGWQYWWDIGISGMTDVTQKYAPLKCPYGTVGDRLWVREAHCIGVPGLPNGMGIVPIKSEAIKAGMKVVYKEGSNYGGDPPPWRPSIHMPRWACRTVLEITEVRLHRLQEISEEDAKAEGAQFHDGCGIGHSGWRHDLKDVYADARSSFAHLWESINGDGSWAENPFVWAISFKKVS